MRISDLSSDVCSSALPLGTVGRSAGAGAVAVAQLLPGASAPGSARDDAAHDDPVHADREELLRRHARCPPGADLHDPADRARDLSRPGGGDNRDGSLRRHGACHRSGDVGRRAGAGEEGCLTAAVLQQAHRPPATRAQERLWRHLLLTALLGIFWLARDLRWAEVWASAGFLRSEEHTSELQSLMRMTYAVVCWKR